MYSPSPASPTRVEAKVRQRERQEKATESQVLLSPTNCRSQCRTVLYSCAPLILSIRESEANISAVSVGLALAGTYRGCPPYSEPLLGVATREGNCIRAKGAQEHAILLLSLALQFTIKVHFTHTPTTEHTAIRLILSIYEGQGRYSLG